MKLDEMNPGLWATFSLKDFLIEELAAQSLNSTLVKCC